jgi:hypothetical protein
MMTTFYFWFIGLFSKRWTVTGTKGAYVTDHPLWYRKKNADIYCHDMNESSHEWFHDEKFKVVRL